MCFQGFAHFACGHSRVVERECHLANDQPLYIRITCPNYTTKSLALDIKCGAGKWYCQQTPEGSALEQAFHQLHGALRSIRYFDTRIQDFQQTLERWVQQRQDEAAGLCGSAILLTKQGLEGDQAYQVLVQQRTRLFQRKKAVTASIPGIHHTIEHYRTALLRREHFENSGIVPPALTQPIGTSQRRSEEVQRPPHILDATYRPQRTSSGFKEESQLLKDTKGLSTASHDRLKRFTKTLEQDSDMATNRVQRTHGKMPLQSADLHTVPLAHNLAAGLSRQQPQSTPRTRPAKRRDLSYLLIAPPLKQKVATRAPPAKAVARKREPAGFRRSARNRAKVNYAESSSSAMPSDDSSPSKPMYTTTPLKIDYYGDKGLIEDQSSSSSSPSKRETQLKQNSIKSSPYARHASPQDLINHWRMRIGLAVPDSFQHRSIQEPVPMPMEESEPISFANHLPPAKFVSVRRVQSAEVPNDINAVESRPHPVTEHLAEYSLDSQYPENTSRRIFYGPRPVDDSPFNHDYQDSASYMPSQNEHASLDTSYYRLTNGGSIPDSKHSNMVASQHKMEEQKQTAQHPSYSAYGSQAKKQSNLQYEGFAFTPTQQSDIQQSHYLGISSVPTNNLNGQQEFFSQEESLNRAIPHPPQPSAAPALAADDALWKRKAQTPSELSMTRAKRMRLSFPGEPGTSSSIDLDPKHRSHQNERKHDTPISHDDPFVVNGASFSNSPRVKGIAGMPNEASPFGFENYLGPHQPFFEYQPLVSDELNGSQWMQVQKNNISSGDFNVGHGGTLPLDPGNGHVISFANPEQAMTVSPNHDLAPQLHHDQLTTNGAAANADDIPLALNLPWELHDFGIDPSTESTTPSQPDGMALANLANTMGGTYAVQHDHHIEKGHCVGVPAYDGNAHGHSPTGFDLDQFLRSDAGGY
ncbi:hypothetical protein K431DRAFT_325941 [Polychaeton citri CBS 116435]|uniref:Uncharacterized protein n=1 Tax=Polychaeton citri CBS 116435 TaxID=1314669 RepID=A0A9P4QCB8_9PEZI|nr:hypothetical protein K431DRAFT_325941 [Polychaeton citri CBS 116435]